MWNCSISLIVRGLFFFAALMFLLISLEGVSVSQGKLAAARSEARNPKKKEKSEKNERRRRERDQRDCDRDDDDGGNIVVNLIGGLFFSNASRHRQPAVHYQIAASNDCQCGACDYCQRYRSVYPPTVGSTTTYISDSQGFNSPQASANPSRAAAPPKYFLAFPYQDGLDSYLTDSTLHTNAIRFSFDYATDFNDLDQWMGRVFYESNGLFAADAQWSYYTESIGFGAKDDMHVGDVNAMLRLLQFEKLEGRFGVGIGWLSDRFATDVGFNGTVQLDYFIAKPVVISTDFDFGSIGDASTIHLNTSMGMMIQNGELRIGYDYRKIGAAELDGMSFGLRWWF